MLAKIFAVIVALVAALAGALVAGVPTRLGIWSAYAASLPAAELIGMSPAFTRPEGYQYSFSQLSKLDLSGQTALVTGANSGLGFSTALHLSRQGAHVILACRSASRCADAAAQIRASNPSASLETGALDTSSLASVRAFGAAVLADAKPLDMLVLNAGIGVSPSLSLSEDGIELLFATNHVGHQLLFTMLLPLLEAGGKTGAARVVLVSSAAHYSPFPGYGVATTRALLNAHGGMAAYGQSKLAQVLFAKHVTERLGEGSRVYVNACHPGAVNTNIWEAVGQLVPSFVMSLLNKVRREFMWQSDDGALTQLFLVADSDAVVARGLRGRYFHPQAQEVLPNAQFAFNRTLQQAVWDFTEQLIAESGK